MAGEYSGHGSADDFDSGEHSAHGGDNPPVSAPSENTGLVIGTPNSEAEGNSGSISLYHQAIDQAQQAFAAEQAQRSADTSSAPNGTSGDTSDGLRPWSPSRHTAAIEKANEAFAAEQEQRGFFERMSHGRHQETLVGGSGYYGAVGHDGTLRPVPFSSGTADTIDRQTEVAKKVDNVVEGVSRRVFGA
jgi:hypothetical protein